MVFAMRLAGLDRIRSLAGDDVTSPDLVDAVLEGAAQFAGGVLAPLNQVGDREGCTLTGDAVKTPPGFAKAYREWMEAGWNAVPFDPAYGGQGLPWLLAFPVQEMWQAANMSFGLCPLLTQGAIEAITRHGSQAQKNFYLEKMISGAWTGTMNLTEPQAGTDLAAVRTRAVRDGDQYRLFGQKIYITYGEHDFTPNIIHMVLARIDGAPPGVKGISLFIAPKFLPDANGEPGARNDLRCVSLEHKLGIHASPTAVMAYGDNDGAVAFLVGEENRGLEYMFTMMNNARLSVGLQGVAIAERAYQQALVYARDRVQGKTLLGGTGIFGHPDVRRMLLHMKASIEAMRGLTYMAAAALDVVRFSPDEDTRRAAQARVELLTPIVKACATDMGCEVASMGVQIHGGMGFIEETGAAQYVRDARIAPIYEGTNGVQAGDLAFRKTVRDQGVAAQSFVAEMRAVAAEATGIEGLQSIGKALTAGIAALDPVIDWMVAEGRNAPAKAAAGAYSYLRLFGLVAGGYVMTQAAIAAASEDAPFAAAKRAAAQYYADVLLPGADALAAATIATHASIAAMPEDQF
jgi:alkylation response protein AidB-like acyl-CoA dehydrogenase